MEKKQDSNTSNSMLELGKQQSSETLKQQKQGKIPIFLGINIESDPDFRQKLSQLFTNAFTQAGEQDAMVKEFQMMATK